MKGYMYILECADGSYYTGSTNNLERRLQQHQNGKGPIIPKNTYLLSWYILKNFNVSTKHFIARSRYRDGAGKKKEALINGCFDKLSNLSKTPLLTFLQPPLIRAIIAVVSSQKKTPRTYSGSWRFFIR